MHVNDYFNELKDFKKLLLHYFSKISKEMLLIEKGKVIYIDEFKWQKTIGSLVTKKNMKSACNISLAR